MKVLFIWKDGNREEVDIEDYIVPYFKIADIPKPPERISFSIEDTEIDSPPIKVHTFKRVKWNDGSFHYEEI